MRPYLPHIHGSLKKTTARTCLFRAALASPFHQLWTTMWDQDAPGHIHDSHQRTPSHAPVTMASEAKDAGELVVVFGATGGTGKAVVDEVRPAIKASPHQALSRRCRTWSAMSLCTQRAIPGRAQFTRV